MKPGDRSSPPKQIDLGHNEYREVGSTKPEPLFAPGGVRLLIGFIITIALGVAYSTGMGALIRSIFGW